MAAPTPSTPRRRAAPEPPGLADPVEHLPGIGVARARALREAGMATVYDVLTLLPFRYEDRRQFTTVAELQPGRKALMLLSVVSARLIRTRRRDFTITESFLRDDSGTLRCFWFNRPYLAKGLVPERRLVVYGEASEKAGGITLENPEYEILEAGDDAAGSPHFGRIVPIYRRLQAMSGKAVRKMIFEALDLALPPADVADPEKTELARDLRALHFPETLEEAGRARRSLGFREVLELQLGLALSRDTRDRAGAREPYASDAATLAERLARKAPFPLTAGQKAALLDLAKDLASARPMGRLLHGEVGAGKTIVALLSAIPVLETGRQVALLAPTDVLARQLYAAATVVVGPKTGTAVLLASSLPAPEKNQALLRIARGEARLVVGTHAILQERVAFKDLAYVIVDEQHRFGVGQRQALYEKAPEGRPPDLLVMSATPIPRTVTLTLYGDLDVTRIAELPPGRQPVATHLVEHGARRDAHEALAAAVARGEQGFVVVPRVSAGTKDDAEETRASVAAVVKRLRARHRDWKIAVLHGQMEGGAKADVSAELRAGRVDVVVATTVVEVGVDVPRATVMIVLQADRFGLSQLHQLRGRVGRSELPSACFLVLSPGVSSEARERLAVLERVADGFQVAEADWVARGPGDLSGERQWGGMGFRVADLATVTDCVEEARAEARRLAQAMTDAEREAFVVAWRRRFGRTRIG